MSYREIGSEFWDVPVLSDGENHIFPKGTQWFLSGRCALEYIISDIKASFAVSSVALPSWCCDSMIIPFVKNGIKVIFYTYDKCDGIFDCDILFCMEHFGYIRQEKEIDFPGIVIHDVTHSVFSGNMGMKKIRRSKQQYFFGSLRKWAGFKTGGFAGLLDGGFTAKMPEHMNDRYIGLRADAMQEKANYISEKTNSKRYLELFSEAEELLDLGAYGLASHDDISKAYKMDSDFVKFRRRENASILLSTVSDIAIYPEVREHDCPLFVPVRLPRETRDALRKHLTKNNVYCPIHWPLTGYHNISAEQSKIYEEELSLVCDQRYTTEDMRYICELIKEFRGM